MDFRKAGFWQVVLLAILLNFVVQSIHEAGHWLVLETMGRNPVWGFNQLLQVWDQPPLHPEDWVTTISPAGEKGWLHLSSAMGKYEYRIMLIAGPLASLFGVILGLSLARGNRKLPTKQIGLVMALIASLIMSQYYIRGLHRMGGDEYFLAADIGMPKYIIDIPLGLAFIISFVFGVKSLGDWRTRIKWLGAIIIGSVPSGLFIMNANPIVLAQVNQRNPLFQPLLGWSLPVLIINLIIIMCLWIWWKVANNKKLLPAQ